MKNEEYNKIVFFSVQDKQTGFFRFVEGWVDLPWWASDGIEITYLGDDKIKAIKKLEEMEKIANDG